MHDPIDPNPTTLAWLSDALARLAPQRRERVVVLGGTPPEAISALERAVGREGEVIADPAEARAGRCDAVFGGWLRPRSTIEACTQQLRQSLRPGGRIVLDLPAEPWSDDLEALRPRLLDCGVDVPRGIAIDALAAALRELGWRDLTVVPRTCLVELAEADELLELAVADHPDADLAAIHLLVLRQLAGRPAPVTSVFRRVQVVARR